MEHILKMEVRREDAIKEASEIRETIKKEDRAMTDEERDKFNRLMEKVDNIDEEIRQEKQIAERASQKRKPDPEKDRAEWNSLGEFVRTVTHNPGDRRLRGRDVEVREGALGDQTMGEGSEGGYLVPDQFSDELLTVSPDEAIIRPRARVFGGNDADFKIPAIKYSGNDMYGGAQVDWIGEGEEKPDTDIEFKQITLQPHEVAAHVEVTDKILRNAPVIEQVVRNQLRGALIDAEEKAFLTGNGSGKPTGIIDHASAITVSREGAGLDYSDLTAMYSKFRGSRGIWIANRELLPELMEMETTDGYPLWHPNARDTVGSQLLGLPLYFSDHSPAMNSLGDLLLVDLNYYLIRDGVGIAIAASPHYRFINNVTVIKAFKTVDGTPWLTGPLPTSYSTSPFVELGAQ